MSTNKYRELAEKQRKMAVSSCEIAGTGWIKSALNEAADTIDELLAMVEWQTMDTLVPTHGMKVILATAQTVGEACYFGDEDGWWWAGNHPTDSWGERIENPTHWRTLPPPPPWRTRNQEPDHA